MQFDQALACAEPDAKDSRATLRGPLRAMQKTEVEAACVWAYRMELPKYSEGDGKSAAMFRLSDIGTSVDDDRDPGFPALLGQPHPDALLIDAAVKRLPEIGLDWAQSRARLMPDLLEWVAPTDRMLGAMSFQPAALVMMHARMGTRPRWNLGPTKVVRVLGKNGKPLLQFIDHEGNLVEGRTTARHYGSGARCVCRLDPPAREIACARAEYFVWRSALSDVANTLRAWKLRDHVVTPPVAAAEPWIVDTEMRSRVLRSTRG